MPDGDLAELVRGLSPTALDIFKRQLPQRLKTMAPAESQRLLSQLGGIPEFQDIVGPSPMPADLAWWQKGLGAIGKVFEPIEEYWAKPLAAKGLAPAYRKEPLWEQIVAGAGPLAWAALYRPGTERRKEYEEWEAPKYVKGAAELPGWFALPTAGGTAAYLRTTGKAGKIAAKALTPAVKAEEAIAYPIKKLTQLITAAVPARQVTKALKHEELVKRVGKAAGILEKGEGKKAFQQSKVALKGELPAAEFVAPEVGMLPDDVTKLFNIVRDSELRYFEKLNTSEALEKLLLGQIPQSHELVLLEKAFGSELVGAVLGKRAFGSKAWERTMDIANAPRAILASWDLSGLLRQGGILSIRHPIAASKSVKPMLKAFMSDKNAMFIDQNIRARKWFTLGQDSGLFHAPLPTEIAPRLAAREEIFMSRWAHKFPLVRPSERAFVTVLNELRSRTWEMTCELWSKTGFKASVNDYKQLARFINFASGRGSLGPLRGTGPLWGAMFFAPRLVLSRLQLPTMLFSSSPKVKREAFRTMAAFLTAGSTLLAMLHLSGAAEVEIDFRSADFGKAKVGETRLDFWTGYIQYSRFLAQGIMAQRKTKAGNIQELNRREVADRFMQTKFSPAFGLFNDILKGESYMGEEMALDTKSIGKQARNRFVPLFVQDMWDAIEQEGVAGGFIASPGLFGVGVITYTDDVQKKRDELAQPYGVLWEELTRETQMRLERESPELQQLLKEREEKTKDTTYGEYAEQGRAIESVYQDMVSKATQKFRDTGNGTQFREDINAAMYGRRMTYAVRDKEERFAKIIERRERKLTPEEVEKLTPEDAARRVYYEWLYSDDMFDQYGEYRFEEADVRRVAFVKEFGQDKLDYVERVMNLRWDEPPELKMLRDARRLLKPYWDIERQVWAQYPPEFKLIAEQIKLLENTDPQQAKVILSRHPAGPAILYARRMIALAKKRLKMVNPQIAQALNTFYRY